MKTPTSFLRPFLVATVSATLSLATARGGDDSTSNVMKFSDPAKPGLVKLTVNRGDVKIRGNDKTDVVTVKTDVRTASMPPRKDGLRVLTAASTVGLSEKDNVITIDAASDNSGPGGNFEVTVPRSTSVVVRNNWGGTITCSNLDGDVEVKSMNGRVKLESIAGSALVETMNGEISAEMREVHETKPLSFTSMNGEIAIRIPESAKANVSLRSQNGAILTDFDEKALITETKMLPKGSMRKVARISNNGESSSEIHAAVTEAIQAGLDAAREATEAARDAMREATGDEKSMKSWNKVVPPMTGGKLVSGTLNGGGVDIQAATMNGEIILRKTSDKK